MRAAVAVEHATTDAVAVCKERELNLVALMFCVACAWSVAQLAALYLTSGMS